MALSLQRAAFVLLATVVATPLAVAKPKAKPAAKKKPAGKPAPAEKAGTSAKEHIARAKKAHQQRKFDVALDELEQAYDLDPQPDLLFAIGQIHVKLDQCAEAINYYEKYLATGPGPAPTSATKQAIETCKAKLPPPKVEPPSPPPPEEPPPPPVEPSRGSPSPDSAPREPDPAPIVMAPPRAERSAWYADPFGAVLVVGGVAAGVVGGVFYRSALTELDRADDAADLPEHDQHRDDAMTKRRYAIVLGAGGAALVVGGVVRLMMRDRGGETSTGVGVVPTADGGLITFGGTFR